MSMSFGDFSMAFVLFVFGIFAFIGISNGPLGIGEQFAGEDRYPGEDTWSFYGTLNGSIETENGDLQLSSSTDDGQFFSDRFTYQDRMSIDKLAVSLNPASGSTEDANITLRTYDEDGVLAVEDEWQLESGLNSYDVSQFNGAADAPEYESYEFVVEIYNPDSQHIEVEDVTIDYTRYEEAQIPFLADLVFLLFFIAGISIIFT